MELHSKDRFRKVEITDIAIKKVQRISYKGLTEDQNDILYRLARLVLIRSKAENNSNEVAYTIDLADLDGKRGFAKGDEHGVNVGSDSDSYHLVDAGDDVAIVHNHPSTQTLSLQDIYLFLTNAPIKVIVVVSNQGTVHYLMKDKNYSFASARDLYNSCVGELPDKPPAKESYGAALDFLTHCTEVGLYYH